MWHVGYWIIKFTQKTLWFTFTNQHLEAEPQQSTTSAAYVNVQVLKGNTAVLERFTINLPDVSVHKFGYTDCSL